MEAGLHLLMGLLSGIFLTLIIFLSSHQFIALSLHLLAFRQSAFIPLLTFPYWPQQFLSILAWLFLLLFILRAGSLSLFDFCTIFTALCFSSWQSLTSNPDLGISHTLLPFSNRICERSKTVQGNGISGYFMCLVKTYTGNRIFVVVWKLE